EVVQGESADGEVLPERGRHMLQMDLDCVECARLYGADAEDAEIPIAKFPEGDPLFGRGLVRRLFGLAALAEVVDEIDACWELSVALFEFPEQGFHGLHELVGRLLVAGAKRVAVLLPAVHEHDAEGLVAEFERCHRLPPRGSATPLPCGAGAFP